MHQHYYFIVQFRKLKKRQAKKAVQVYLEANLRRLLSSRGQKSHSNE